MSSSGPDSVNAGAHWCAYLRGRALLSGSWAGERVEDGGGVEAIRWNMTCARRSRALSGGRSPALHLVLS
jgi:hypothetical protein